MTSSARASRSARGQLRGHDRADILGGVSPLRFTTRRTCSSSGQSTTRTRATRDRSPPRSSSSGTRQEPVRRRASPRRRASRQSWISGWRMASRRARACASAKTRRRSHARSSSPSSPTRLRPERRDHRVDSPASPRALTACAAWSASATSTPRAAKARATSDLPLPMPPVRPMTSGAVHPGKERSRIERSAEEQRDRAGDGEIRAEGQRNVVVAPLEDDQRDADERADDRRHQDDQREHLPAEPRAERGQQLEVAVPHAFLAADQLEQPVDDPQRQVARDRADDRLAQRHEQAEEVDAPGRPRAAAA